jgi:phosphoglycerate dehydrogenase-like enzyme
MNPTLRIWSNMPCAEHVLSLLQEGARPHELIIAPNQTEHQLDDIDVAYGQPNPEAVLRSRRIKWVQVNSAGYTRYDNIAFRQAFRSRGGALTNSSSVLDEPCAEHALSLMLALARDLPTAWEDQHDHRRWPTARCRQTSVLLKGQTVLIVGFGAIGRRLAELLEPFHMQVIGVRRHPKGDEGIAVEPVERLDDLLPEADHVMNILPSSPHTRGLFDASRFDRMKRTARFYNIGRGDTVDQDALGSSLEAGRLNAAYLDVTTPEPLPADHPLWTTRNCFITPHSAGGHWDEHERLVEHFIQNLRRFERGEELTDQVV